MQGRDLFKLSTRMFKARTARTLLTILGMGIGIGAILFLVGLGYGLQNVLLEKITTSDSLLTLDVAADKEKGSRLSADTVRNIEGIEGVAEVVPAYDLRSQLKFQDVATDATAVITKSSLLKLEGKNILEGNGNFQEKPRQIVITSAFSKIFEKSPEEFLGKPVSISLLLPTDENAARGGRENLEKKNIEPTYEITGVIESEEPIFYVTETGLEEHVSNLEFSRLKVKCLSSNFLESLKGSLLEQNYVVSSLSETVNEVNKMFRVIKIILALFGMVALLVSAIGMFNTMTVALLERTKEIGIMKSIGASEMNILLMFIIESTLMGFLGGLTGVALGILSGGSINFTINTIASRMGGDSLKLFYFPFWFILFILVFSLVIGFLTGLVPARKASAIDPLDALRSK